ncbi:hypothetical protein K431DRAFT_284041 [Polychaeton citri CBS 116435]|uniref:CUE domain-containing protein n=1 Tax=Polychaeton citri CBS 116435 TaxID=1314669 RepID=A0A9P4QCV9_9PEZI|nr:hypothetical protein K431DRAFT_284041 [Polychaeton citri CBS 116435]
MADQNNYYQPPQGPPPGQQQYHQHQANNPYSQPQPGAAPGFQPETAASYGQYQQQQAPPPNQSFAPPRKSATFQESDFVPESERGEQREMMEQFEMSKAGGETQEERDLEQLQREFPGLDGSLVAAIYGDSKNVGATREMLGELAGSQK